MDADAMGSRDEFLDEQFPLSPIDDFMIHQTPDPVRVMWTTDPRAYERYWMLCHDQSGEILLATGGSFYPNLDRAEAFAIVSYVGRQSSVRAFRALGADRVDLRVGPIAPTILRGLRQWRYTLERNEVGICFDLEFADVTRQVFREPISNSSAGHPPGRRSDVTSGFEGFGDVRGWVDIGDHRVELSEGSFGTRDRHWGTGRGVGGPALAMGDRLHVGTSGNAFVSFPGWSLWGDRIYYRYGDPRKAAARVGKPSRRLRFDPESHVFLEGYVDYPLDDGRTTTIHYERISDLTVFLRCGMYGGTPDRDIHQGGYDGPELVEGETYDVTSAEVRRRISGLNEHLCQVSCEGEEALGVFQTIDPAAYEACVADKPGWAFL